MVTVVLLLWVTEPGEIKLVVEFELLVGEVVREVEGVVVVVVVIVGEDCSRS